MLEARSVSSNSVVPHLTLAPSPELSAATQ